MSENAVRLIVVGILLALVLLFVVRTIKIVPQARVGIVERLGRFSRNLAPGLHVVLPFVDRLRVMIDMRETVIAFPPSPVITKDNVQMQIDTVFYFQVTDPFRATYEVSNLIQAVEQLTATTLRNVIGSLDLEEVLTSRDQVNQRLRIVLDEATEKWGLRVNRIELKSIDPPASIIEAMEKQLRADRTRRAAILTAEGDKQSNILTAEGERQAAILRAEAQQRSQILEAEGDRQAAILRAEGEATAVRAVFQAIHEGNPSPDLLAYKYLETLPLMAAGQATKLLMVPTDAVQALGGMAAMGAAFQTGKETAETLEKDAG